MTDTERAAAILRAATLEISALYDCEPNRPLGWVEQILEGLLQELEWKVEHKIC